MTPGRRRRAARLAEDRAAGAAEAALAAARRRTGLRARIAVAALLRRYGTDEDRGPAFARALSWGEAAAVALAALPAAAPAADAALLAAVDGEAGAEEFFARLGRLQAQGRAGAPFDAARAAPAELLARCLARAGGG